MKNTEPDSSKSVTVYAAIVMTFSCPHCRAPVQLQSDAVPREDFNSVCSKCKGSFLIKLNRRQYYRKEVSIPLAYSLSDINAFSDRKAKTGIMVDISQGGLCIKADINKFSELYEKPGNIIVMLFSLSPRKEMLKVKGEILALTLGRDRSFQMGVRFLHQTEHQKKEIGFFLLP